LHATTNGFVIGIYHQCAISDNAAHTIHSSGQLEHYKHHVDDKSAVIGGLQRIVADGYVFPLAIQQGVAWLGMTKPTAAEFAKYPHVIMTSDLDWDLRVLDYEASLDNDLVLSAPILENEISDDNRFDVFGRYISKFPHVVALSTRDHTPIEYNVNNIIDKLCDKLSIKYSSLRFMLIRFLYKNCRTANINKFALV
jgi:hypothetical protein